jgi:hypothetical protein
MFSSLFRLLWLLLPLGLLRWNRRRAGLWRGLGQKFFNEKTQIHWSFAGCKILQFFVGNYLRTWPRPKVFNHLRLNIRYLLSPRNAVRFQTHVAAEKRPQQNRRRLVDEPWFGGCSPHPKERGGVYRV